MKKICVSNMYLQYYFITLYTPYLCHSNTINSFKDNILMENKNGEFLAKKAIQEKM